MGDAKQELIDGVLNIVRHSGSDFVSNDLRAFMQERIGEPVELGMNDIVEALAAKGTPIQLYRLDGKK